MNETVTRRQAAEELKEVYPQATVETYEDMDIISAEFNVSEMYEEEVLVHYETPSGWFAYKTIFGRGKVKFYLETYEEEGE